MKFFFILSQLFSFILSYTSNIEINNKIENENWYYNISVSLKNLLNDFDSNNETKECFSNITSNFMQIFLLSDFNKISSLYKEEECDNNNFSYFLFIYQLENSSINNDEEKQILEFSDYKNKFSTGICVPNNCKKYIEETIFENKTLKNSKLKSLLEKKIKINELIYYIKENNKKKEIFLITIIKIYILIRIIITCLNEYSYCHKKEESISIEEIEEESNEDEIESICSEDSNSKNNITNYSNKKKNNEEIFGNEIFRKSIKFENNEKKGIFFSFNLVRNLSIYNSKKEKKWFNDENLEIINFIRSLLLFFCIFERQIYSDIKFPTKDIFNYKYYSKFRFIFGKFCQFSCVCYYCLDGFLLSFKFLYFYKKNCIIKKNKFYKAFYKFLIMTIPKIILYYFNFYLLHFHTIDIVSNFNVDSGDKYYLSDLIKYECYDKTKLLNYIFNFKSFFFPNSTKLDDCHKIFYIYHNELIMLFIFIIFFIILMICESFIVEIIIINIPLIPLIFYFVFFQEFQNYDVYFFYGEINTIKYIYFFIGIYFIGILNGIAYFHFIDSISPTRIKEYIPFKFLGKFAQFLHQINNIFKGLIIIFCSIIIILLSSSFYICRMIYDTITFKINGFMIFLYYYEKNLFVIFFNLLLLVLLVFGESFLTQLGKISLINLISRNSFTIFASYDYLIIIFYTIFDYESTFTLIDSLFFACGEFFFVIVFSLFFDTLFELPFRIIIIEFNHSIKEFNEKDDKLEKLII